MYSRLRVSLYQADYPGKRDFLYEDILSFDCSFSQTLVNVEQDGLAVAKRQKSCFVYNNYVNVQLIDY